MAIKAKTKVTAVSTVVENPDAIYVVSYSRISSDKQKVISIEAQQDAIHKYCDRHGYTCVKDYADEGISGLTDERPGFQQMIHDAIVDDRISKVIVHKIDRFSRHNLHSRFYINKLQDAGVRLESVMEYFDETPAGTFMRETTISLGGLYTDNLKSEVMKVLKLKATRAEHTGGRAPYGYVIVGDKMMKKPVESTAVKLMFQMVDYGCSYSKISKYLYDRGYRSRSADGRFKKSTIKEMLQNEKYMGTYTYNKANGKNTEGKRTKKMAKKPEEIIRVEQGCPAIVSEELFNRVQHRLASKPRGSHGSKYYYPLSDNSLMICQHCGKPMKGNFKNAGRNATPYYTYVCNGHRSNGCPTLDIQTKYVEDFTLNYLHGLLFQPKMKPYLLALLQSAVNSSTKEEKALIKVYEKEIDIKTKEIKKWLRIAASQDEAIPEVKEMLKRLNAERKNLTEQIAALKEHKVRKVITMADIDRLEDQFIDYLKKNDTIATRQFMSEMIDKITVGEKEIEVVLNIA